MRISFILLIFLILFNGWGALLMEYDIDDHLGINAETGDAPQLDKAQAEADELTTGNSVGQTLLGYYNALLGAVQGIIFGLNPAVQLLSNILPPGIAQDLIVWGFGFIEIVMAADILAYARGVDL